MLRSQENKDRGPAGESSKSGILYWSRIGTALSRRNVYPMNHLQKLNAKSVPTLSLDFVSGELPLCDEVEWVNQGSGQAQHQTRWFVPWSHKSWVGDVSPETVYREKTCLQAGVLCLSCKDITEDCTGLS